MNPERIYRQYRDDALAKQVTASKYATFVAMPFGDKPSYHANDILRDVIQEAASRANENKNEKLVIFVNGKKKTSEEDDVTNPMSVDAIARLAGLTGDTAIVRRRQGEDGPVGDPLTGEVRVKNGEHFVVTRRNVEGGLR